MNTSPFLVYLLYLNENEIETIGLFAIWFDIAHNEMNQKWDCCTHSIYFFLNIFYCSEIQHDIRKCRYLTSAHRHTAIKQAQGIKTLHTLSTLSCILFIYNLKISGSRGRTFAVSQVSRGVNLTAEPSEDVSGLVG